MTRNTTTVGDLCAALDAFAPFAQAAEWDNVGLLAGRTTWPATRAVLAIDLSDAVAREALKLRADVLVLYHPPIFKGIRRITADIDGPTTLLPDLLAARVAIIAMHTALDAAAGGTNDALLDLFEVTERFPLEPLVLTQRRYKLVVFVPPADVPALRAALAEAGAGVIGHYAECSYELAGHGTFRGDRTTNPRVGRRLALERVEETRLEMVVPRSRVGDAVRALYRVHAYEEPAFDLYPVDELPGRGQLGMGRVGRLVKPQRGTTLLDCLRGRVDLSRAAVVGDLRRTFTSVTAAAGAFGVRSFRDRESLVVTGELKHHDALALQRQGLTAVHLGHYASERPVLDVVQRVMRASLPGLKVAIARADRCPLAPVPR